MATIKDVAQRAGVSVATVSRVLNHKGPLSEKTINLVHDTIKELDYHPNNIARSLVKGKCNSIGVLFSYFNNPFWSDVAYEIEQTTYEKNYRMILMCSNKDANRELKNFQTMRSNMVDGILLSSPMCIEAISKSNLPIVVIENQLHDIPSVVSDDYQGGILAARHLISKGCKYIVHISGDLNISKHADARTYAFIKICEEKNVQYKLYQTSSSILADKVYDDLIEKVFYENPNMDGIFASNDVMGAQCIKTAMSLGYKVPEDIKIIGYDGTFISRILSPELTTIQQDTKTLAQRSVNTLIDLIEGKEVSMTQIVPVKLVERKTT